MLKYWLTYNIASLNICSGGEKHVHYVNFPESGGLNKNSTLILLEANIQKSK
jgi:hypothetical protein